MDYKFAWYLMKGAIRDLMDYYKHGDIPNMADGMKYDKIICFMDNIERGLRLTKAKKTWLDGEIVKALEFGFACLGVLMLVLVFMGRLAYVG